MNKQITFLDWLLMLRKSFLYFIFFFRMLVQVDKGLGPIHEDGGIHDSFPWMILCPNVPN